MRTKEEMVIEYAGKTKAAMYKALKYINQDLTKLAANVEGFAYYEIAHQRSHLQTEFIVIMHELTARGMTDADHARCNAVWNRIDRVEATIERLMDGI